MLQALNGTGGPRFSFSPGGSQKLCLFTTYPAAAAIEVFNDPTGGLSIRKLFIGPDPGILLAGVHFPSRVPWSVEDQTLEATWLAEDIRQTEDRVDHHRRPLSKNLSR